MSQRKPLAACICIIALSIASLPVQATEFSGRAEVAFSPKSKNKKRAQAEQRAVLATLEQQARQGVIENALASVYGPKDAFLGKYEAVLADCVSNSSMLRTPLRRCTGLKMRSWGNTKLFRRLCQQ